MAKRVRVGTDVYITDLTHEQRSQLVEDLAKLRAAGAPDNTAAVCLAVHEAALGCVGRGAMLAPSAGVGRATASNR